MVLLSNILMEGGREGWCEYKGCSGAVYIPLTYS